MNSFKNNYVVLNSNTKKMEASFSSKLDSINYSIMLYEIRNLNSQILKVDDEALGRYFLDFRTDDAFLNKEVIFDTKIDYEKYQNNILKTNSLEFEYKNDEKILDDILSKYEKENSSSTESSKEIDSKLNKSNKMR